jgi:hypothetical protein
MHGMKIKPIKYFMNSFFHLRATLTHILRSTNNLQIEIYGHIPK